MDFEQAKAYALERLERELPPELVYHSLEHTRDDVVPAAARLAHLQNLPKDDNLILLLTAAYYHDIGYVIQRQEHEKAGVDIATEVLTRFGYNKDHIAKISDIIMATRLPQSPSNTLEAIMADADLDVLSRPDNLEKSLKLRAELAAFGTTFTDAEWFSRQTEFLKTHQYFTAAAKRLHHAGKRRNIAIMSALAEQARRKS